LTAPIVPAAAPPDKPKLFYRRGRRWPRAIAWFGFKSFWGHLWHLVASVVATEDIDSRDWMQPDDPADLGRRIAKELGVPTEAVSAASLTEAMGRDLWIDFVADTGDDFSISKAVAKLVAAIEIHNRVVVPWNQVLKKRDDGKSRYAKDAVVLVDEFSWKNPAGAGNALAD
jgi:hypothetical protein